MHMEQPTAKNLGAAPDPGLLLKAAPDPGLLFKDASKTLQDGSKTLDDGSKKVIWVQDGSKIRISNESWVIVGSVAEPTITNFHLTCSV